MSSAADKIKAAAAQGASKSTLEAATAVLAAAIGEAIGVKGDAEVAILLLNATGGLLKFVAPKALYDAQANFPASQKDSFAVQVLQTRKGKVDNKFGESKHLKFFEMTKFGKERGAPIQKMLALPLVDGTRVAGVVEVSRKGADADAAGPNFTPDDAQKILALLKTCLTDYLKCVPKDFV